MSIKMGYCLDITFMSLQTTHMNLHLFVLFSEMSHFSHSSCNRYPQSRFPIWGTLEDGSRSSFRNVCCLVTTNYIEIKVYIQKQMMSVKSRHLLLHFYKISIPISTFLPALQNLKNAPAVELRSSSSQPASHGFLDCLVSLLVMTSQVIFQGPEQVVVWGDQIRTVRWMGE
jgi:hypothetical protein